MTNNINIDENNQKEKKASLTPAFVGCFPRPLRQNRVNGRKTLFSNVSFKRPSLKVQTNNYWFNFWGKFQNKEV